MHSIIVPIFLPETDGCQESQFDWLGALKSCILSINCAFRLAENDEYEIVVMCGNDIGPQIDSVRYVESVPPQKTFNKPALLNQGIKVSRGNTISFLDADVMVGVDFSQTLKALDQPSLTKVCYRLRYLPAHKTPADHQSCRNVEMAFDNYEAMPLRIESYGQPHLTYYKPAPAGLAIFGNSQFSITRKNLGDVRYRETCENGRASDLVFNLDLAVSHGEKYKARIFTDAAHSLLTFRHPRSTAWNRKQFGINLETYSCDLKRHATARANWI